VTSYKSDPSLKFFAGVALAVTVTPVSARQRTFQLPTATEVFNLRSKCAALGEKILEDNFLGRSLTQSQVSHYDPQTNRCYVELTVQSADLDPTHYYPRVLFDGQTKEMLAFTKIEKGKKGGLVYDRQHQSGSLSNAGWDDATEYIDEMIKDDRR
jgi:hypothetical protein